MSFAHHFIKQRRGDPYLQAGEETRSFWGGHGDCYQDEGETPQAFFDRIGISITELK